MIKYKRKRKPPYEYPWLDPKLRDDVTRGFNLRLNELYLYKLRYISEKSGSSMQQFCQTVLRAAIDEEIQSLTNKTS